MLCAYGASAARILLRETTAESRRLWWAVEPIAATGPQGRFLRERKSFLKKSAAGHGAPKETQRHKAVWLAFSTWLLQREETILEKKRVQALVDYL